MLRDACPPPELLVEMREAAWVTSPCLHSSSNLSGDEAKASAIRVKQTEACSNTYKKTSKMMRKQKQNTNLGKLLVKQQNKTNLPLHRDTEEGLSTGEQLPSQSQQHLKEASCTCLQLLTMLLAINIA